MTITIGWFIAISICVLAAVSLITSLAWLCVLISIKKTVSRAQKMVHKAERRCHCRCHDCDDDDSVAERLIDGVASLAEVGAIGVSLFHKFRNRR